MHSLKWHVPTRGRWGELTGSLPGGSNLTARVDLDNAAIPDLQQPIPMAVESPKTHLCMVRGGAAPGVLLAAKRDAKQSAEDGRSPYWSPMMGGQRLGAAHHFQVHLPVRSISALSPSVSSAATGLQHHSNGLQRPRRLGIKSPWTHINCMQRAEDEAT